MSITEIAAALFNGAAVVWSAIAGSRTPESEQARQERKNLKLEKRQERKDKKLNARINKDTP